MPALIETNSQPIRAKGQLGNFERGRQYQKVHLVMSLLWRYGVWEEHTSIVGIVGQVEAPGIVRAQVEGLVSVVEVGRASATLLTKYSFVEAGAWKRTSQCLSFFLSFNAMLFIPV